MSADPCVIGVAEHAGWAHFVCVAAPGRMPAVVDRRRVALIEPGLPTMPYHHESIGMREADANALIARVQQSIAACASRALQHVAADLAPAYAVVALAVREPVFPSLPPSVAPVRASYRLQCAADGVMYQLAVCRAAREQGIDVQSFPRGTEAACAAAQIGVRADEVEAFVSGAGRPAGPPWTQEHRRAYAAALAVLSERLAGVQLRRRIRPAE